MISGSRTSDGRCRATVRQSVPAVHRMAHKSMFYKCMGPTTATRQAAILHGLLGSHRNWQTFARALVEKVPDFSAACMDLRNHGHSTGFPAPHTLQSSVADLLTTARSNALWPSTLIGHSMGGKVLLSLAASSEVMAEWRDNTPDGKVDIFVVDSFPGTRDDHETGGASLDGVESVLKLVRAAPFPIPSRQWVVDTAAQHGLDKATSAWLASNITHLDAETHGEVTPKTGASSAATSPAAFRWLFDPDTATHLFQDYLATDLWPVLVDGPPEGVNVHLIQATKSSRWHHAATQEKLREIQRTQVERDAAGGAGRGQVHLHTIASGHWVHVDNPSGLLAILLQTLLPPPDRR